MTALQQWVHTTLADKGWLPSGPLQLAPLPSDAGFRRYFRLNTDAHLLAVVAPPTTEKNETFVFIAKLLREQGIHAPEVFATDYEQGFLLVEDLGGQLLLDSLEPDTAHCLYGEVITDLLRIQQIPTAALELPAYDQPLLRLEMSLFEDWFATRLLGHTLTPAEQNLLHTTFAHLEALAAAQPQVLVHRDFHSRNLIVRDGLAPGVVDFQDGVVGPITYDLVSLLRDCYIRWPTDQVERWALAYGNMAVEVGLMRPVTRETFLRWFDWMGLQRHIKVLGIFARLHLRDGKDGYLQNLPLVLRYTLEVAEAYPELLPFADWLRETLLPLAKQQHWYSDYRSAGNAKARAQ
ncbi:phosphotransferase [Simiduia sp. 21SJ11W-1]|uniref:aminoglycoside phosphotransferase family protein n=1 Tax=Simiduia sp. 21SJ11W-1 TaxID=2909669 RepID=UPI00209F9F1D|nr:phosphotransferase [Simiduia sp. 21SJ11W-1]UTA49620.1 phosphotransferase [Simiduia sp. 21SJ11W-1]